MTEIHALEATPAPPFHRHHNIIFAGHTADQAGDRGGRKNHRPPGISQMEVTQMGWFDKPKDEREANIAHHKAMRKAAEEAARKHRDHHVVHDQLNEAVIEAERDIPWWRR